MEGQLNACLSDIIRARDESSEAGQQDALHSATRLLRRSNNFEIKMVEPDLELPSKVEAVIELARDSLCFD
jgi:hypothetical protein